MPFQHIQPHFNPFFPVLSQPLPHRTSLLHGIKQTVDGGPPISIQEQEDIINTRDLTSSSLDSSSNASSLDSPSITEPSGASTSPATQPPTTNDAQTTPPSIPSSLCPVSGATTDSFAMNTGGEAISSASMGAENMRYISNSQDNVGDVFASDASTVTAAGGPKPWDLAYSTYRWIDTPVLKYDIPFPPGRYTVKLLFAETLHSMENERIFHIFINGVRVQNRFDIFATAGGKDIGVLKEYRNIASKGGFITISLIQVIEHPCISGIIVEGPGAGERALGGGCGTGDAVNEAETGGFDHRAHSVPGGPYVATDFDKDGVELFSIDGTLSHTHSSDPGPPPTPGFVVSYRWTWTEIVQGVEIRKDNTDPSGKFNALFPLGKTTLTLEIVDNTGDVHTDFTTVEVKSTTTQGAYCYAYNFGSEELVDDPLLQELASDPKPLYGAQKTSVDLTKLSDFGDFPFANNSFAYRCDFFIRVMGNGTYKFSVKHNGPFTIYVDNKFLTGARGTGETALPNMALSVGLRHIQVTYFRPRSLSPELVLLKDGIVLAAEYFQHDASTKLPVISRLSKMTSVPAGGGTIQIHGSGFTTGVSVKFGTVELKSVNRRRSDLLQTKIPPGNGSVLVTVSTPSGVSNGMAFSYGSGNTLRQPVVFKAGELFNTKGTRAIFGLMAAIVYGPDHRLYIGSIKGKLHAIEVDKEYTVIARCSRDVGDSRAILDVRFSPFSNKLKLFFTSSTLFWKGKENSLPFEEGWTNGKIQTLEYSTKYNQDRPKLMESCAGTPKDLVTGLPVSAHDHAVNKLEFLPDGRLLVSIGGFTNGGISTPGKKPKAGDPPPDNLGGVASNPLSAAIVSCPTDKVTNIIYDVYDDPENAKIIKGNDCEVYASGLRNSFGITLHTNGHLYATDNGPSQGNGDFSTDCRGGFIPSTKIIDKLFKVVPGGYHGHPNLNREQCEHYPASAVQPIRANIESSTDGIVEYRSNTFGGQMKGNLYLSKFASNKNTGRVSQVSLGANGLVKSTGGYLESFFERSGVSVVEGPRGELVMPQVYQGGLLFLIPVYPTPSVTFLLGVLPKRGPATGGTRVLISGHNFGTNPVATFNNKVCTNVISIDDESFTCVTPAANKKNSLVGVTVVGTMGSSPSYGTDYWYY